MTDEVDVEGAQETEIADKPPKAKPKPKPEPEPEQLGVSGPYRGRAARAAEERES